VLMHGLSSSKDKANNFPTGITGGFGGMSLYENAAVAVLIKHGKGEIIVTTIEPFDRGSAHQKELLSTILANAGLDVPLPDPDRLEANAFLTYPVKIDGMILQDWLEDIEDSNVSFWRHAEPVYLPAAWAVRGTVKNDQDLSGILYVLHDKKYLNVAGIVFGKGSRLFSASYMIGDDRISIFSDSGGRLEVNGKKAGSVRVGGYQKLAKYRDSNELDFTRKNSWVGNLERIPAFYNKCFEARIPWSALKADAPSEETTLPFAVELSSGGRTLRAPMKAKAGKIVFNMKKK
jgi:hypothetical protein